MAAEVTAGEVLTAERVNTLFSTTARRAGEKLRASVVNTALGTTYVAGDQLRAQAVVDNLP